jgi:phage terminase large subunit GpA-like protein
VTATATAQHREEVSGLLAAFARGVRPRPVVSPADWGRDHFVVPDGPQKGQKLDLSLTPYVVEILDALRPDSPWTEVTVKKSAQTGLSTLGLVWLGCLIDTAPDDMMIVQPTIMAAREFNQGKLDPVIKSTAPLRRRVRPQHSRSAEGSTTLSKRFAGGRLILTGANSAADLSSKTVRYALCDEVDRWPQDIDGQGDPMALLDARQISFSRSGGQKKLVISTPTIKGSSRIDRGYEAGDQRVLEFPCPHCGDYIDFRFEQMRGERVAPHNAHYMAQCCGAQIDSWQQRAMVQAYRWRATRPGFGRQPSFSIWSAASLITSWDKIWSEWLKAEGDPLAEKAFVNLWLGESYEETGSEIDPGKIAVKLESYPRNEVPANVGRTALVVDTQDDRLEWALYGFGPPPTSSAPEQWLLAAGIIEGDLTTQAPWDELDALAARQWPHQGGMAFPADAYGIDTGGHHTQAVYRFVWRKKKWRALKGSSQRDSVILSSPKWITVKDRCDYKLFRVPLYFVGGHELKLWLSHALGAIEQDKAIPGRLHLTDQIADIAYLEQMTAEVLVGRERRDGRVVQEWKKIRARNEALDLAVYARALAFGPYPNGMGVDRIERNKWSQILSDRHGANAAPDLFAPELPVTAERFPAAPAPAPAPDSKGGFLGGRRKGWL